MQGPESEVGSNKCKLCLKFQKAQPLCASLAPFTCSTGVLQDELAEKRGNEQSSGCLKAWGFGGRAGN